MNKILQKFFRGYAVLEEVDSPINRKIQVRDDWFGRKNLVVGGISQSGERVERVWKEVAQKISSFQFPVSSCLILGLGAGSVAKVINKNFPEAKITGVEIDSEVVKLGKKFFDLSQVSNLEIKLGDAVVFLNDLNHFNKKFDLILVDLYIGSVVPVETETEEFLGKIKKCLAGSGVVIFNRLYFGNHKEKTDKFGEKLKKIFTQIEAKKVLTNKLFLCLK